MGELTLLEVWFGGEKIWPTTDVVQITLGTGLQARNQLRAALTARGLDYQTITEIPFDIELVGTGSTQNMFYGSAALTHVPYMDTSNVTNMNYMFRECYSLTHVPDMNTSQVTGMEYMFFACAALTDGNVRLIGRHPNVITTEMILNSGLTREPFREEVQITLGAGTQARDQFRAALTARGLNYATVTEVPFGIELVGTGTTRYMFHSCEALTHAPIMDTSQVTDMSYMFNRCSSLTRVPGMDTAQVTNMDSMFYTCSSLTRVPDMDTGNVTNMNYMFRGCESLTQAPSMVTSQVTNMYYMFYLCSSLTHIPDMDTGNATEMSSMLRNCSALTDGNVRLIGRHPEVVTGAMTYLSGLTREPFYDAAGNPI